MLTPVEIQGITFKTGRGYKRDDVDSFMQALYHDYEIMYKENQELKNKIMTLSDGIQYYKNLEKTLQKALVLAEKTSEETKEMARKQAETIEHNAKMNAEKMLYDARKELDRIEVKTQELIQNFELYKAQYRQIISTQLEFVQSSSFEIKTREVEQLDGLTPEKAVPLEIKKALDVDKAEVKSAEEEAIQEHNLAEQVKLEQKQELEEAVKEEVAAAKETEKRT
ncbi:MAG: DivIVA domain-containing protein, partial [Clostridium sp.]|nr:DivIVA domain-containing protein [Clostridium sp.]